MNNCFWELRTPYGKGPHAAWSVSTLFIQKRQVALAIFEELR